MRGPSFLVMVGRCGTVPPLMVGTGAGHDDQAVAFRLSPFFTASSIVPTM
jgi:hypothetical protein